VSSPATGQEHNAAFHPHPLAVGNKHSTHELPFERERSVLATNTNLFPRNLSGAWIAACSAVRPRS
jgi:hypothetical protein